MAEINNIQNQSLDSYALIDEIKIFAQKFDLLKKEISQVVIGNNEIIQFIISALLCNGHILLEGVPGVAKTTMIKTVSKTLGLQFKRIQFTPDLLPADLIGTLIFNPKTQDFETKKGPIFANIILADEINRAPAKVQSALLESMQEHQATIGSTTFLINEPFFVFATQNPVEQEGTYQLPEAQLDRFMYKLIVSYPSMKEEIAILKKLFNSKEAKTILNKNDIFKAQELVKNIYIDDKIIEYIVNIVSATRNPELFGLNEIKPYLNYGASPRATIGIHNASKAMAFLNQRHFVIPDDIKHIAHAILRHRIALSYEAQADDITTDTIITKILNKVPTP